MEDKTIVSLFEIRNERAIDELKTKYERLIMKTAMNFLTDRRDAEECVNDTYLSVWNSIPPAKPLNLCAYICAIVRNLSLKKYEYNTADKRRSNYEGAIEELSEELPDMENDTTEIGQKLNEFLSTLEKESRKYFVRRYWAGEKISDIAEFFGVSEAKVKTSLFRTRKKLGEYLKKEGMDI